MCACVNHSEENFQCTGFNASRFFVAATERTRTWNCRSAAAAGLLDDTTAMPATPAQVMAVRSGAPHWVSPAEIAGRITLRVQTPCGFKHAVSRYPIGCGFVQAMCKPLPWTQSSASSCPHQRGCGLLRQGLSAGGLRAEDSYLSRVAAVASSLPLAARDVGSEQEVGVCHQGVCTDVALAASAGEWRGQKRGGGMLPDKAHVPTSGDCSSSGHGNPRASAAVEGAEAAASGGSLAGAAALDHQGLALRPPVVMFSDVLHSTTGVCAESGRVHSVTAGHKGGPSLGGGFDLELADTEHAGTAAEAVGMLFTVRCSLHLALE
jgi:hypothetical protein